MSGAARREALLDATSEVVAEQGFAAVTIEAVTSRAGVTRTLVYKHFSDVSDLLEAMIEREMARALAQVDETALADLSQGPPVELMLESLGAYLNVVRTHPTTWRLVHTPPENAPEVLRKGIAGGRAQVLARMIESVRPAFVADREPPDAELTARMLSAMADEYARLVLADPDRFSVERLLAHARWMLEDFMGSQ
jgi:AcrR family transcriptional regulator